jgi:hypothetical protein
LRSRIFKEYPTEIDRAMTANSRSLIGFGLGCTADADIFERMNQPFAPGDDLIFNSKAALACWSDRH